MKKLFELILDGWWHKWKIIETTPCEITDKGVRKALWTRYYLQCERCGEVKVKDTM